MRPARTLPAALAVVLAAAMGLVAAGPAEARMNAISADGRYVAAVPFAIEFRGSLLIDRRTGTARQVARQSDSAGGAVADEPVTHPAVSDDGRYVAFATFAGNLSDEDRPETTDVFVRDTSTGTTTLVSRGEQGAGNAESDEPSISADGRYVAFISDATNLHPDDRDGNSDVYVRDLHTGRTELIPIAGGAGAAESPALSADGGRVAFVAKSATGADGERVRHVVQVHDRAAGTTDVLERSARVSSDVSDDEIDLSRDGRRVAYVTAGDAIEVVDLATGRAEIASRATGRRGRVATLTSEPSLSTDGRFVAFRASALDPVDPWPREIANVYVRDMRTHRTVLVSRTHAPDAYRGRMYSRSPAISGDGRLVAYWWDGMDGIGRQTYVHLGSTAPPPRLRLTVDDALRFPARRSCRSRRTLSIGVRRIPNRTISRITITTSQNGKRVRHVRHRPKGSIVLRGMTGAPVFMAVHVRLTNGSVLVRAHRLGPCPSRR